MKIPLATAAATLCLCASAFAWTVTALGVHDGDSINVLCTNGTCENIRLYGIDAPELRQDYGPEARRGLAKLVGRGALDIEPLDRDKYGRTVALVRLEGGVAVNEAQVAQGNAWVFTRYCRQEPLCSRLAELEARARAERRGLWAGGDPVHPADWRRDHKSEEWYMAPVRAIKTVVRALSRALP